MKLGEKLVDKAVAPLLLLLFTPAVILIGAKLKTGDWLAWFSRIPPRAWIIFGVACCLAFAVMQLRRRLRYLAWLKVPAALAGVGIPRYGWVELGSMDYHGVRWRIQIPAQDPFSFVRRPLRPENLHVDRTPRCPCCETELEEQRPVWGGFRWWCVGCNFRRFSRQNFTQAAGRATRLARRNWEIDVEEAVQGEAPGQLSAPDSRAA